MPCAPQSGQVEREPLRGPVYDPFGVLAGSETWHAERSRKMLGLHRSAIIIMAAIAVLALAGVLPAACAAGDKQGWSTTYDPRKRVFLSFVPAAGGPRSLTLACLRDVDMFSVMSEGVVDARSAGGRATLTLTNDQAHYVVEGEVGLDPVAGLVSFSKDIDADARALQRIRSALLPVLEGKGPILITIGSASRQIPVLGLAGALERFKSVCFGSR